MAGQITRGWSLEERFRHYIGPADKNGCWLWQGSKLPKGYGLLSVDKTQKLAHRISWELHRGPIPLGLFVCHKCDVPGCCNPEHLFLGTVLDNNRDKISKGRSGVNGRAKLTQHDVRYIRKSAKSTRELVLKFGVGYTAIYDVRHRKTWRHVA